MPKHKLYHNSFESPHLNSSMESKGDESDNSPVIANEKQRISKNQDDDDDDNYEIFSTQNGVESENDEKEKLDFPYHLERRPYSYDEDVEILNFVLKDQNIYKVSSILLWKYLEVKKKNPRRTYQSLKNRFLRNIKPKIFTTYRHLIKNQDQFKKIVDKFPELKKDARVKEPLSMEVKAKKENGKITDSEIQNVNLNVDSRKIGTLTPLQESTSVPSSQLENGTDGSEKGDRKVTLQGKSIYVVLPNNLAVHAPSSSNQIGIYEKYLSCKAKNKLTPCPACGRCGGPELEPMESKDSENENDIIISNSIENKNSERSQNSADYENKINSSKDVAVKERVVKGRKSRRVKSPENSNVCSSSPSFLDCVKSPDRAEVKAGSRGCASQIEDCKRTKTTSSNTSTKQYATPEEQPSADLTDEELEDLYNESMQKCEKLISSEEEEALVKKCFKKNRRALGFDSYVLLHKTNLDSFFAKSQSPPLHGLSEEVLTSEETSGSPLVENMRRMLRPRI